MTLDCDALGTEDNGIEHVSGFSKRRRINNPGDKMNRLYAVESRYTITGGIADHRLMNPSSDTYDYLLMIARSLIDRGLKELDEPILGTIVEKKSAVETGWPWVAAVAKDLLDHRGESIVIAGRTQSPAVHALVLALNVALGNLGKTLEMIPERQDSFATIAQLADGIKDRKVETLVILGGNPAYDAPADLDFAKLLPTVAKTIRVGTHFDETSTQTTWHLSATHALESWDLAVATDGNLSAIQPMIEPLFDGRSPLEIVAHMIGFETHHPYEIVRKAFKATIADSSEFEAAWRTFLHDGFVADSAPKVLAAKIDAPAVAKALRTLKTGPGSLSASKDNLELVFHRDAKVNDGRFANNGWLQEVPDPITKLTWDNAALMSPRLASALEIKDGDVVTLSLGDRSLEIAALIAPGQAEFSIAVALGYGRTLKGRVGKGVGFNAYALRTSDALDASLGLRIARDRQNIYSCENSRTRPNGRSRAGPRAGTRPNR